MLGPVFRAYDPGQDKLVAVKLFRLDIPPERVHELVADLDRLIAADLTHSSIVAAIATGIVQASPYLAQDFVAADALDTVLREHGPAPAGEGLRIVTQIAGGLDFAAVLGVVHGALHPRDVLISPDDVRITGIGVARALERVGVQVPVRRPYAAPERVEGGAWDRRADVFTLATLAHELLWGRRVSAIGDEAAAALDELPGASLKRLREIFARALAGNPARRFPTTLEFADALKGCFADRREARPVPPQPATEDRREPADDVPVEAKRTGPVAAAPLLPLHAEEPDEADEAEDRVVEIVDAGELTLHNAVAVPVEENQAAPAAEKSIEERVGQPMRFGHPATVMSPEPIGPARSAVWPLSLALLVGLAVGFAGGYWLGQSAPRGGSMEASAGSTTAETEVRLKADATAGVRGNPPAAVGGAEPALAEPPPAEPAPITARPTAPAPPPVAAAAPKPVDTAAVARTGRITIRTTPAGARVTIDGRDVGKAPLTVPNLTRGSHTVRIVRDGYTTVERRVQITAAEPSSTIALNLTRTPAAAARPAADGPVLQNASVLFESRPSGATVFLDGTRVGTTPMALPSVRTGSHAVRFEMAGHKPWSASVPVVAGEKNRVAASLEQQ